MFEYIAVLTSIIVGLGITHLLQGTARVIQDPEAGRPYWLHLTWAFYMFLTAVFWWWWEFRLEPLEVWTFQVYAFVILFAVALYLLCAMRFPPGLDRYDGSKDYFYSRRAWFFGLFNRFSVDRHRRHAAEGRRLLRQPGARVHHVRAVKISLCVVAMRTRNESFHGAFCVANVLHQMSWALRLYETVG